MKLLLRLVAVLILVHVIYLIITPALELPPTNNVFSWGGSALLASSYWGRLPQIFLEAVAVWFFYKRSGNTKDRTTQGRWYWRQ